MIVALVLLFFLYALCMVILIIGFIKAPLFYTQTAPARTRFTVLIPFRNEEENLPDLLQGLKLLDYPSELFEIIFIDDFSEDNSAAMVASWIYETSLSARLLLNEPTSNSPKKDAISLGISHATGKWIITTDADCVPGRRWLMALDSFINWSGNRGLKMVCAPVIYNSDRSLLQEYQLYDGLSLQLVTSGTLGLGNPVICNGANLAFEKAGFKEVNGFLGNDHIASGDDIFLMEKFRRSFKKSIGYLRSPEATVYTRPQDNWKDVLQQRIRWASKTSKQENGLSMVIGTLVFGVNLAFLLLPLLAIIWPVYFNVIFLCFSLKIVMDYLVLKTAGILFSCKIRFKGYVASIFLYPLITVLAVFGSIKGYSWKGRDYPPAKNGTHKEKTLERS